MTTGAIDNGILTRAELLSLLARRRPGMSRAYYELRLRRMVESGEAARVGRGEYLMDPGAACPAYSFGYSDVAKRVAGTLLSALEGVDFRVFELAQLNEFLNHQIGRGVVLVSVERELQDFAFDGLVETFPGIVLFRPSVEDYHRYATRGAIVVVRLVTEAPALGDSWGTPPEKFLVDLLTEPLLHSLVPEGEVPDVYRRALGRYAVNAPRMLRYAARRGCRKEVSPLIDIAPRTGRLGERYAF